QIQVIYFLGSQNKYLIHSQNIICNLSKDKQFDLGEEEFETYKNLGECELCKNHSRPIDIHSDVFLTIQPKIEKHRLNITSKYFSKDISRFIEKYKSGSANEGIIKVFYKENHQDNNYEIYFDFEYLLKNIHCYKNFNDSLGRYINKYIPAN